MLKNGIFAVMILALMLMATGLANAANGVLACVARHIDGQTNASFQLSNLSDSKILKIDNIYVYDMNGNLICEGPTDYWPFDQQIFPTNIAPNGGTWFGVHRMIDQGWCPALPEVAKIEDVHWLIVKIEWSTNGKSVPLYGRTTEVVVDGEFTVGRDTIKCDTVE